MSGTVLVLTSVALFILISQMRKVRLRKVTGLGWPVKGRDGR